MADILLLDSGDPFLWRQLEHPVMRDNVCALDMYEFPGADLDPYVGLIVPGSVDQELLDRERGTIREFLDQGKVLVFSGHLFRPWLPGGTPFIPKAVRSIRDYAVRVVSPHPIFEGVPPEHLTFRRGVAGFFARGHHPPPPGAEVLLALEGGEPIVYVDRQSTKGTILAHAGNDLWGLAGDETAAHRVVPQLFTWIRAEQAALQKGRQPR